MSTVTFIGAGSFGTALSTIVAAKGCTVNIFDIDKAHLDRMEAAMENTDYLPGVKLEGDYHFYTDNEAALKDADIVVFSIPAQHFRAALKSAMPFIKEDALAMNIAKGIEQKTLMRLSEIASETIPSATYVALSGPSHAEEIVRNFPAGVVAASKNKAAAEYIQDVFMSDQFRVYTQEDMTGVEIAGAVKNVIAITTGISDGMKLGSNARAALMTRAIHEIKRLGTAMGANPETFSGLSGIGDLIVTCSTNLSRNRRCGLLIGLGLEAEDAVRRVGSVVEGYYTAEAVCELAEKYDVEMPICTVTNNVLKGELEPEKALKLLMSRSKKDELQ